MHEGNFFSQSFSGNANSHFLKKFFLSNVRNEKYLAAVAAGKWVLHKSFLEASREAGVFVDEVSHEWGQNVPGEPLNKLATAAQRWRLRLLQERAVRANVNICRH